jgi:outer membrane protein
MKALGAAWFLLAWATAGGAGPVTLTAAWQAAREHDPTMAGAAAQRDAGAARGAQGRALWMPTLAASGSVGLSDMSQRTQGAFFAAPGFGSTNGVDFQTRIHGGTATRWAFTAEQPLFDLGRFADGAIQKDSERIAAAEYRSAEQDLMVRSARAYFDVLNARSELESLLHLRAAAEQSRGAAQARYEAGDIPSTDAREAQASADAIDVQVLDARAAVSLAEAAFSDLTGLDAVELTTVPEAATADLPAPEALETWTQQALADSPQLAMRELQVSAAASQVNRYDALGSPRVSLVAQLGEDYLHGNGQSGIADIAGTDATIGIQASIPLFTGGLRTAQRHEAQALVRAAEAARDTAVLQLRQQTRAAWLALTTAAARVQALQRLRASAQSRLDATRLGAQIGERTTLELLAAEADFQRSGADFRRAQGDWLLAGLTLKAAAGELTATDLAQVDARLAGAAAP